MQPGPGTSLHSPYRTIVQRLVCLLYFGSLCFCVRAFLANLQVEPSWGKGEQAGTPRPKACILRGSNI